MPLKPWYKNVTPREDLREGKPLDAAEFALHLDDVRNNCAQPDYQKPERFFARTYLTKKVATIACADIRWLLKVAQVSVAHWRRVRQDARPTFVFHP